MLRGPPCSPATSSVPRAHPSRPRQSVRHELLTLWLGGVPAAWAGHFRAQRCALASQKQGRRLRQPEAVRTKGFSKVSAEGGDVPDDGMQVPIPLLRELEEERWKDESLQQRVMEFMDSHRLYSEDPYDAADPGKRQLIQEFERLKAAVHTNQAKVLLQETEALYSAALMDSQIIFLLSKWLEVCEEQGRRSDRPIDGTLEKCLAASPEALEPLCWRKVENTVGLSVSAADVFWWAHTFGGKESRMAKGRNSRGFASTPDRSSHKSSEELTPFHHEADMAPKFLWYKLKDLLNLLLAGVSAKSLQPIRLLLRQDVAESIQRKVLQVGGKRGKLLVEALEADLESLKHPCETYAQQPSWDQLVSRDNDMVLLYHEAAVPATVGSWTLPVDPPPGARADGAAPVLMLSILQHGVRMNVAGVRSKMMKWLSPDGAKEQVEDEVDRSDVDLFGAFANAFSKFSKSPFGFAEAEVGFRSKVSSLWRKVYSAAWSRLTSVRLQELTLGQKEAQLQLRRLRERDATAVLMEADLSQAISNLKQETFDKKLSLARQQKILSEAQLQSLQDRMSAKVIAAQEPLQQLVSSSRSIDEALNPEVLRSLSRELERTRLSSSNRWVQAGMSLKSAMEGLQQLQVGVNEFLRRTGSSQSSPRHAGEEGLDDGNVSAEINRLSEELNSATTLVRRYERFLRAAGREVSAEGLPPLNNFLSRCETVLSDAKRDNKLLQALLAPPWSRKTRLLAGVTEAAFAKLQVLADRATESGRSRLQAQLQEAADVAQVSGQLREAMQGDDEGLLAELVAKARALDIGGLGDAQRRCEQLRAVRSDLRQGLTAAVEQLDLPGFQVLESRAASLPPDELEQLRRDLQTSIAEEEEALREMIASDDVSEEGLQEVLTKCRLSSTNALRLFAEGCLAALRAAAKIRAAMASLPLDETQVQACLSSGSFAAQALADSGAQVQQLLGQGVQVNESASTALQTALDEGYLGLAGGQADRALETLLGSELWKGKPHFEAIQPNDLRELEVRAEEATAAGRERLAQPLSDALEVGQCSVELAASTRSSNTEQLESCLAKAEELGLKGLEKPRLRLQTLKRSVGNKRLVRRPVREVAPPPASPAQEGPALNAWSSLNWKAQTRREEVNGYVEQVRSTNLIFLDLETTSGFYDFDQVPQILEVAVIIANRDLQELERGHWVLGGFSQEELEGLSEFHKENFRDPSPGGTFPPMIGYSGGNGLFSDVLASRLSAEEVEVEVMRIATRHCPPGECPLVGYSVQCDREVLKQRMPRLYRHLSHQIVDVSGFFTAARLWLPDQWQYWERKASSYNHRAMNDAEDAIEALRWVRDKFFSANVLPLGAGSSTNLSALGVPRAS